MRYAVCHLVYITTVITDASVCGTCIHGNRVFDIKFVDTQSMVTQEA